MVGMLLQPKLAAQITLTLQNAAGQTALSLACEGGHRRVVELLLQALSQTPTPDGSNLADMIIDLADDWKRSPFACDCASKSPETVELFLGSDLFKRKVVDPNSICAYGMTPLASACRNGRWKVVQLLLDRFLSDGGPSLVNFGAVDGQDRGLLSLAARGSGPDATKTVLVLLDNRLVDRGFISPKEAHLLLDQKIREYLKNPLTAPDMGPLITRLRELGCEGLPAQTSAQ